KDHIRLEAKIQRDQLIQDWLSELGKASHFKIEHQTIFSSDAKFRRGFDNLRTQDIPRQMGQHRLLSRRKRCVYDAASLRRQPRHGSPAPKLPIIGMRGENESGL